MADVPSLVACTELDNESLYTVTVPTTLLAGNVETEAIELARSHIESPRISSGLLILSLAGLLLVDVSVLATPKPSFLKR